VLIDCLHLTHCLRPGILTWYVAAPFGLRLAMIGCKLLLLTLTGSKETIWNRGIRGRADSPFLTQYALKFGRIQQQIHAHFVEEQAEFVRMFSQSVMNKRLFENAGCLDNIIEAAYTFWLERPDTERGRFHTTGA